MTTARARPVAIFRNGNANKAMVDITFARFAEALISRDADQLE